MLKEKDRAPELKLVTYTNKDLVQGLAYLSTMAMSGKVTGLCFAAQFDRYKHKVGVIGNYRLDPHIAIRPIHILEELVMKYSKEMESFSEVTIKD